MASKSALVVLAVLSILAVAGSVTGVGARSLPGSWQPIKGEDLGEVLPVAEFAVVEHNKEKNTSLRFVALHKGEMQVVAGIKYRLTIEVTDSDAGIHDCLAVVYAPPGKPVQLISFQPINNS